MSWDRVITMEINQDDSFHPIIPLYFITMSIYQYLLTSLLSLFMSRGYRPLHFYQICSSPKLLSSREDQPPLPVLSPTM